MSSLRYLLAVCLFPVLVGLGFALDWRLGLGVIAFVGLVIALQSRRLGTPVGRGLLNLGRALLVLPLPCCT